MYKVSFLDELLRTALRMAPLPLPPPLLSFLSLYCDGYKSLRYVSTYALIGILHVFLVWCNPCNPPPPPPLSPSTPCKFQICAVQMGKGLSGVSADQMANVVIAYEPVRTSPISSGPEISRNLLRSRGNSLLSPVRMRTSLLTTRHGPR